MCYVPNVWSIYRCSIFSSYGCNISVERCYSTVYLEKCRSSVTLYTTLFLKIFQIYFLKNNFLIEKKNQRNYQREYLRREKKFFCTLHSWRHFFLLLRILHNNIIFSSVRWSAFQKCDYYFRRIQVQFIIGIPYHFQDDVYADKVIFSLKLNQVLCFALRIWNYRRYWHLMTKQKSFCYSAYSFCI